MNRPILKIVMAIGASLVGILLLGLSMGTAASADRLAADVELGPSGGRANWSVRAARMFTIPFGISSTLEMDTYGDRITVTGHGQCEADSSGVFIGSTVSQEATNAMGGGYTEDDCRDGKRFVWEAEAETAGAESFVAGQAQVCATALEFNWSVPLAYVWCKEVTLQ